MATNEILNDGSQIYIAVPSGVTSNAPTFNGGIPGVALVDRDTAGNSTIKRRGSFTLSVKGINDAGNVAVAVGDPIFYVDGDTPKLSKKASGKLFGYALAAVTSGSTTSIQVLLVPGGSGQQDAGVHMLAVSTNGTNAVAILGATLPVGIKILGFYGVALDTTAGTITLAFGTAGTVGTFAKGTASGALVGCVSLSNTVAAAGDALTVVSSSAGNAQVFILYQVQP